MEVRNRIKDLRIDKDLRQSDLAKVTGIDQRTISNFFNVSIDYILYRTSFDFATEEKKCKMIDRIKEELEELKKF